MIEALVEDMFTEQCDARCITTNGFLKVNGRGVMGAGVAGVMQRMYPDAPLWLGEILREQGNHVAVLRRPDLEDFVAYVAFPVKHVWYDKADPELIVRSAHELMLLVKQEGWQKVLLPRPGCGNGRLDWESEVKPLIEDILDDRVWVVTNSAS